jgi:hypothetical protein
LDLNPLLLLEPYHLLAAITTQTEAASDVDLIRQASRDSWRHPSPSPASSPTFSQKQLHACSDARCHHRSDYQNLDIPLSTASRQKHPILAHPPARKGNPDTHTSVPRDGACPSGGRLVAAIALLDLPWDSYHSVTTPPTHRPIQYRLLGPRRTQPLHLYSSFLHQLCQSRQPSFSVDKLGFVCFRHRQVRTTCSFLSSLFSPGFFDRAALYYLSRGLSHRRFLLPFRFFDRHLLFSGGLE